MAYCTGVSQDPGQENEVNAIITKESRKIVDSSDPLRETKHSHFIFSVYRYMPINDGVQGSEMLLPKLKLDLLNRHRLSSMFNLPRRQIRPTKVHSNLG